MRRLDFLTLARNALAACALTAVVLAPQVSAAPLSPAMPGLGLTLDGLRALPGADGLILRANDCLDEPSSEPPSEPPTEPPTEPPSPLSIKAAPAAQGDARLYLANCGDGGRTDGLRGPTAILKRLTQINEACGQLEARYRVSCVAGQYGALAEALPDGNRYSTMKAVLRAAAEELEAIAQANLDAAAPPVQVRSLAPDAPPATRKKALAVRPEAVADAAAAAVAILDQTTTILLRSAENSAARASLYQSAAQAIDSTKVLLRSA